MKFVDINKKAERKFIPLNEHKETKFNSIIKETKCNKVSAKIIMLENTLFDLVLDNMKKQSFNESRYFQEEQNKEKSVFKTNSWADFRKHALLLTEFMNLQTADVNAALDNFENALAVLGEVNGETGKTSSGDDMAGVERGYENLDKLDNIFKSSGINAVKPNIGVRHFLDILQGDELKNGTIKQYDISSLVHMILERDNRSFSRILAQEQPRFLDAIKGLFGEDETKLDIFRKVVRADNYTKNNAMCGKAEIALAMFFGDCKLPDDKGDIRLLVDGKDGASIEVKGNGAVITDRETLNKEMKEVAWSAALSAAAKKISSEDLFNLKFDHSAEKTNNVDAGWGNKTKDEDSEVVEQLNVKDKKNIEKIRHQIDLQFGDKYPEDVVLAAKFKVTFGALFKNYSTIGYNKGGKLNNGFNMMVIFNTDDDVNQLSYNSKFMTSPLIKIVSPNDENWIANGEHILDYLLGKGITVKYQDAHSQGGFKAWFTSK